jgi:hypothetical protein
MQNQKVVREDIVQKEGALPAWPIQFLEPIPILPKRKQTGSAALIGCSQPTAQTLKTR